MSKIGAKRMAGCDNPTVWSVMTPLAIKTKSMNLGQGFPSWSPPDFYLHNLDLSQKQRNYSLYKANHQYQRAFGSIPLVQAIANYHMKKGGFKKINHQTQIVVVNGGVQGLYCCIMAFVDNDDEVICFQPAYDCYRAQIQMAGGVLVGITLKPKYQQSKAELRQRCKEVIAANEKDDWQIDYELLEKSLSEKTKMIILNSPHNPVGKVFSQEQLKKLAEIIAKYPKIIVVEDNVYEDMTFDDMYGKSLPKMAFQPGLENRSLSVYSAGKIFSATGVRCGWVIGHSQLIQYVRSVHQYNVFCGNGIVESTVAKSLIEITKPESTYMLDYATRLTTNRDILLKQLIESKFQFDLWIPKGGYFIIAGIENCKIDEKYMVDEEGKKRTKDYAFCIQLAYEEGVVAIPCSAFYSAKNVGEGEKYIRFAFCKDEPIMLEAGKRMK